MPVSQRLAEARQRSGLTVQEVAAACGITPQSVEAYEAGRRIPRDSIKVSLSALFGCTLSSLFF